MASHNKKIRSFQVFLIFLGMAALCFVTINFLRAYVFSRSIIASENLILDNYSRITKTNIDNKIYENVAEITNFFSFPSASNKTPIFVNNENQPPVNKLMQYQVIEGTAKFISPLSNEVLEYDSDNSRIGECCEQATKMIFADKKNSQVWIWFYGADINSKTEGWFGPFSIKKY